MSKPTITVNNGPAIKHQDRVSLTAGDWTITASDPQAFVNVGGNPRARGQVTLKAVAGKVYDVSVTGGFFAVLTAQAPIDPKPPEPPPVRPRNAVQGMIVGHQAAERNAVDEEGLRLCRFASMVSSDWLNPTSFSLDFAPEIDAAKWHRRHMPAGSHLNLRGPNLWNGRKWSSLDIADWQQWANAVVDSGLAALVDSFAGPNEPNGRAYSGDPDRDKPSHRQRINEGWNAAAKILRERTGKPVATPSYVIYEHAVEAILQCTNCNAVDAHPYQWNEQTMQLFAQRCGEKLVMFTEWAHQTRESVNGNDDIAKQANENRKRLALLRRFADFMAWYSWRIPRPEDDARDGWMSARKRTGEKRGEMYVFAVQDIGGFKPQQPTPTTPSVTMTADQRAVFDAINAMRAANGLPACVYDEELERIGQTATDRAGLLDQHDPAAGGRGVGGVVEAMAPSVQQIIADWRTGTSPEHVIGRGKINNPAHKRVGVGVTFNERGIDDAVEVYAVFGV